MKCHCENYREPKKKIPSILALKKPGHYKTTQGRQKSYVVKRRHDLEFSMGDCVFLKVSLTK